MILINSIDIPSVIPIVIDRLCIPTGLGPIPTHIHIIVSSRVMWVVLLSTLFLILYILKRLFKPSCVRLYHKFVLRIQRRSLFCLLYLLYLLLLFLFLSVLSMSELVHSGSKRILFDFCFIEYRHELVHLMLLFCLLLYCFLILFHLL